MGILLVTTERRIADANAMWSSGLFSADCAALSLTIDGVCSPDEIASDPWLRLELQRTNAAPAGFSRASSSGQTHILLREKFFNHEQIMQQFIMAHELRHGWQQLVSAEWIRHDQERKRIISALAHDNESTQDYSFILSGPVEVDAECWAVDRHSFNYSEFTKKGILRVHSQLGEYSDATALTIPVLAQLLPKIYRWSHSRYRAKVKRDLRPLLLQTVNELRAFVSERCRPAVAERDLIKIASQENPAQFLSATKALLVQLQK